MEHILKNRYIKKKHEELNQTALFVSQLKAEKSWEFREFKQ